MDLLKATLELRKDLAPLRFGSPVAFIYNPLDYALEPYELYLNRFANTKKRVVLLGMNPGPFGMTQTGVPFGEIAAVRDWLKIEAPIRKPKIEHPRRPIEGFACKRSEVSGRRLWGAIAAHFGTPERFFKDHFVANYSPLVFMEKSGRNFTPDKLPPKSRDAVFAACDKHLKNMIELLQPEWVVGVGAFAEQRAQEALAGMNLKFGRILHPSPSNPAANKGWDERVKRELIEQGICSCGSFLAPGSKESKKA